MMGQPDFTDEDRALVYSGHTQAIAARPYNPTDFAAELRRFNAERQRLLQGRPISGDRRIPGPYSGVGGDVEEPQR